jgi:cob(I)alamin adenosyltransferase
MIQIYTGNGKGKTTASVGAAIRALGHRMNVVIIQLFKSKNFYGEQKVLSKLNNINFYCFAPKHPYFCRNIKTQHVKKECQKTLKKIEAIFTEKKCDVLILDEINIAIRDGFIKIDDFLKILKKKPKNMEVIITGRDAHPKLLKMADLVSEIKEIKHPFNKKVKSRKGIEF